jgi:thiamine-monophosphate kinase
MRFQHWGEDSFIAYLQNLFPSKKTMMGIGDDCAVIPGKNGLAWLVTTDALVEGVHFIKKQIHPKDLGYKTVAVNVSDITAMGGDPKHAFLSIALPKTVDSLWVRHVMEGIKEACEKWDLQLLGGDTVGSKRDIFLNLTLIGSAKMDRIKYRHQAKTGDVICVAYYLGDSGGGLKALQEKKANSTDVKALVHAHFRPEPCPQQGMWLAKHEEVHAMMDISDGLDCDLKRLLKCSQKGAVIETTQIPYSAPLARVGAKYDWDILELALTGGEDYALLLTVSSDAFTKIQRSFQKKFGIPLYDIGRVTQRPEELIYHKQGSVIQLHYTNFDHFR